LINKGSGVSTLIQTIGVGPIGARLPIVQGTSFGFLPVALPLANAFGLAAVLGASLIAGLLQVVLGAFLRKVHHSHLYLLGGESYRLKQKTLS
jgi:NCS2 family nucleobase:cation symporter-2